METVEAELVRGTEMKDSQGNGDLTGVGNMASGGGSITATIALHYLGRILQ